MRRGIQLTVVFLGALLSSLVGVPTESTAACLLKELRVTPTLVAPGEQVTVNGDGFTASCQDTINPSTSTTAPPVEPIRHIELVFEQPGLERSLAVIDVNPDLTLVTTKVTIPIDAHPGPAELVARWSTLDFPRASLVVASSPTTTTTTTAPPTPIASPTAEIPTTS